MIQGILGVQEIVLVFCFCSGSLLGSFDVVGFSRAVTFCIS